MIKKRRDKYSNSLSFNIEKNLFWPHFISKCSNTIKDEDVSIIRYEVLRKYGQGFIKTYAFPGVTLSISDFKLKNDILLNYKATYNRLQLSFLMIGEKIITLKDAKEDIICESGECYMVNMCSVEGKVKISSKKPFKEVKIRISAEFFKTMNITDEMVYKKLSDTKLVIPINNELFKVLRELDSSNLHGLNRKIFLMIKVLELLVLQRENYIKSVVYTSINGYNMLVKNIYTTRQYILDNIKDNFSIKDLSRKVGVNSSNLSREFKRLFGQSINEFSRNKKMNYAQYMLKNTELTIYQISEEIGYKNATHFTVAFKKHIGVTPKKYRLSVGTDKIYGHKLRVET